MRLAPPPLETPAENAVKNHIVIFSHDNLTVSITFKDGISNLEKKEVLQRISSSLNQFESKTPNLTEARKLVRSELAYISEYSVNGDDTNYAASATPSTIKLPTIEELVKSWLIAFSLCTGQKII